MNLKVLIMRLRETGPRIPFIPIMYSLNIFIKEESIMPETDNLMHHIKCAPGQLGKYVILPGDPGRVEKIAAFLENPHHVQTYREYTTWNGTLEGETVTVMSTGMGGPSTAIGVEELKKCGAEVLIRVGTCGAIDPTLVPGTSSSPPAPSARAAPAGSMCPWSTPAVPNFDLVMELNAAAKRLGYPQRQRYRGVQGQLLRPARPGDHALRGRTALQVEGLAAGRRHRQ